MLPHTRIKKLRQLLNNNSFITVMQAHDASSAFIIENTKVKNKNNEDISFDALWASSLCDSLIRGYPDTEIVDISDRISTIRKIFKATKKPLLFDADSGGNKEHLIHIIPEMEKTGISAIVVEDKKGLKNNSLIKSGKQAQCSKEDFCDKIQIAKKSQLTTSFMFISRIESLILGKTREDALERAISYTEAGSDAIVFHSKHKTGKDALEVLTDFRKTHPHIPVGIIPTSYCDIHLNTFKNHGVNFVIYGNQLARAAYTGMQHVADSILEHGHCANSEENMLSIQKTIALFGK